MGKKPRWKVAVTALSVVVWVIGMGGLPDDLRRWWEDWLPAMADWLLANLQYFGNAAVTFIAVMWLHDALAPQIRARRSRRTPPQPARRPRRGDVRKLEALAPRIKEIRDLWHKPSSGQHFISEVISLSRLLPLAGQGRVEDARRLLAVRR